MNSSKKTVTRLNYVLPYFRLKIMNFAFPSFRRRLPGFLYTSLLLLATGAGLGIKTTDSLAAEEIVLIYSALDQPVLVEDLETFVETGKMSPSIRFLVGVTKQDPEDVRKALTQEISVDGRFVYKVFNSLPGEYILFQAGQVVHPRYKPNRAIIPALRGTLTLSTIDDGKISLLEFFQKYPTKQMYIDGRLLKNTAEDVIGFINNAKATLEVPLAIAKDLLEDMVCDCEVATSTSPRLTQVDAISSQK